MSIGSVKAAETRQRRKVSSSLFSHIKEGSKKMGGNRSSKTYIKNCRLNNHDLNWYNS
jgi:hypothetical protein